MYLSVDVGENQFNSNKVNFIAPTFHDSNYRSAFRLATAHQVCFTNWIIKSVDVVEIKSD